MLICEINTDLFFATFIDNDLHSLDVFLKTIVLVLYHLNCLHLFMILLQFCCKIPLVLLQILDLFLVELDLLED